MYVRRSIHKPLTTSILQKYYEHVRRFSFIVVDDANEKMVFR